MLIQRFDRGKGVSFKYEKIGSHHRLIVNPKNIEYEPILVLNKMKVFAGNSLFLCNPERFCNEKENKQILDCLNKGNNSNKRYEKGVVFLLFLFVTLFCIHKIDSSYLKLQTIQKELDMFCVSLDLKNMNQIYEVSADEDE